MPGRPAVIGVDGCRDGWIGVHVRGNGSVRWMVLSPALELEQLAERAPVVAIDIPIGLPVSAHRRADLAAKRLLGGRTASSVFFTPVRAVLQARSYPEACEISRRVSGKAISRQAWHIVDRIRAVDDVITSQLQGRVIEAHPEVSFRAMSATVTEGKKTGRGVGQRIAALEGFIDVTGALRDAPAGIALDDLLDALACAWTARRWSTGRAVSLPDDVEEYDARGLRMRIVA